MIIHIFKIVAPGTNNCSRDKKFKVTGEVKLFLHVYVCSQSEKIQKNNVIKIAMLADMIENKYSMKET